MEKQILNAMEAEKARQAFINDEQIRLFGERTITEVALKLNLKNRACEKAVGTRGFKASQFVRSEGNGMWFKREQDAEETFIKNCWIKNYDDVVKFIEG